MGDGQYEVWWINPHTDGFRQVGYTLDLLGVAKELMTGSTGYDADQLALHMVTHLGRKQPFVSAERWLEDHPVEALIAAWEAGTPKDATNRQDQLHKRWPALAKAISNVQTNYLEVRRAQA